MGFTISGCQVEEWNFQAFLGNITMSAFNLLIHLFSHSTNGYYVIKDGIVVTRYPSPPMSTCALEFREIQVKSELTQGLNSLAARHIRFDGTCPFSIAGLGALFWMPSPTIPRNSGFAKKSVVSCLITTALRLWPLKSWGDRAQQHEQPKRSPEVVNALKEFLPRPGEQRAKSQCVQPGVDVASRGNQVE